MSRYAAYNCAKTGLRLWMWNILSHERPRKLSRHTKHRAGDNSLQCLFSAAHPPPRPTLLWHGRAASKPLKHAGILVQADTPNWSNAAISPNHTKKQVCINKSKIYLASYFPFMIHASLYMVVHPAIKLWPNDLTNFTKVFSYIFSRLANISNDVQWCLALFIKVWSRPTCLRRRIKVTFPKVL